MKNIRMVLFGELILFVVLFAFALSNATISSVLWFVDFPSLILIALALIPGLIIMGAWKDFLKSFSVGVKHYKLLELKNIVGAVVVAQKLTVLGALFGISEQTVKNHFSHIYEKAWVPGRKEFRELFVKDA